MQTLSALRPLLGLLALLLIACPSASSDPDPDPTPAPRPAPGVFQAGAAVVRMPVPVGIGTSGNSFLGGPDSDSPYADSYPATRHIHGHPDIRAVMYSRGEGYELILVRIDMIAAVQQLRDAVVAELLARTGHDWDDALVLGATHTHSGPGRFIQGFFSIIADDFFPAHYERLVGAIADAVEEAYADLAPAELAVVRATAPDGHDDRRCEDGEDYTNDAAPLLAVRKDGALESVVMAYAIHGTVLGMDDLTLSKDVSGAIESFSEAALGEPDVMVMMMNSWGADTAPATPDVPAPPDASPLPGGYDKMEKVGAYMAGVVATSLTDAAFESAPNIEARVYRYPIGYREIGYQLGEFPYLFGGVYCQGGLDCSAEDLPDPPVPVDGIDEACVPFPETSPAPMQSIVSVGRIGDSHFTTWAGECGTRLAEQTIAGMEDLEGVQDVVFFGYSNDYLGYALQYDDWYYGGYEASGAMWGPRQGEYMSGRAIESMTHYVLGGDLPYDPQPPEQLFDLSEVPPVPTETALEVGAVAVQPGNTPPDGVVTATVYGSDAWFGAPVARLQRQDGADWVDVVTPDGRPFTSDGYGFWVDLELDPPYADSDVLPMTRHFSWTFHMPVTSRIAALAGVTSGAHRLVVTVPTDGGDPLVVETEPFAVE
jgi:hypothetical protein